MGSAAFDIWRRIMAPSGASIPNYCTSEWRMEYTFVEGYCSAQPIIIIPSIFPNYPILLCAIIDGLQTLVSLKLLGTWDNIFGPSRDGFNLQSWFLKYMSSYKEPENMASALDKVFSVISLQNRLVVTWVS